MKKRNLLISLCAIAVLVLSVVIYSSCKGPKGDTGPNGNDGLNGIDANSFCKTCHTVANWTAVKTQLEASKHGNKLENMADEGTNKSCAPCHSQQGYLETLVTGQDTTAAGFVGDFTLTCEVCHQFHGTLQESDFPNYAIRNISSVTSKFNPNISWNLGGSNVCMRCHQNRPNTSTRITGTTTTGNFIDTIDGTAVLTVDITSYRFGGHNGPQAQLFYGVGGGDYELTGSLTYSNSPHRDNLICGDCHVLSTANSTDSTGGHFYKLVKRDSYGAEIAGTENVTKCVSCHTGTTNHNINGKQTTIKALMKTIEDKGIAQGWLLSTPGLVNAYGGSSNGNIIGNNGTANASSSNPRTVSKKKAAAIFNFKCVYKDMSFGVHNADYIEALLTNSNEAL